MLLTEKHRSRNRKRLEQQEQKQPEAGQYGVAVKMGRMWADVVQRKT